MKHPGIIHASARSYKEHIEPQSGTYTVIHMKWEWSYVVNLLHYFYSKHGTYLRILSGSEFCHMYWKYAELQCSLATLWFDTLLFILELIMAREVIII